MHIISFSFYSKEGLKDLLGSVGLVKQVKILPAREGRDITLAYVTQHLNCQFI